eukprot:gene8946-6277_t
MIFNFYDSREVPKLLSTQESNALDESKRKMERQQRTGKGPGTCRAANTQFSIILFALIRLEDKGFLSSLN